MSKALSERACTPCRKGVPPLEAARVEALAIELPGWSLCENATRLERRHDFPDFATAFAFATRVAAIAEAADHHPDIAFGWGYVRFSLQTHSIGGLHENDFILAARFDQAFAADAFR